jgi:hypothetical protein
MVGAVLDSNLVFESNKLTIRRTLEPTVYILVGAVDWFNVESVASSLESVQDEDADLVLNVSQLEFRGVGDIEAMVSAAKKLKGRHQVLLYGLPPVLQAAMVLVGWAEWQNLALIVR